MLSVNLIERHFESRRHEALLDALVGNGFGPLPLPLRIRLADAPAAAIALGLKRVVELTYGPTGLSRAMARTLREEQGLDGSFGADPLTTACAAAALGSLIQEHATPEGADIDARDRALHALAAVQEQDGLFRHPSDRTEQDRALTSAFVLMLLGGDESFRGCVRFAELMSWFESHENELEESAAELWTLARAGSPRPTKLSPAVNAIAA